MHHRAVPDRGWARHQPSDLRDTAAIYRPFGTQEETIDDLLAVPETKGYGGERFDADAGLRFR